MLKMKTVWQDGAVDWVPVLDCDHCKEEITGGVDARGVLAWEINAVAAIRQDGSLSPSPSRSAYEVVTGETFHLHTACLTSWAHTRGGLDRWMTDDLRSLPRTIAKSFGVEDADALRDDGWLE